MPTSESTRSQRQDVLNVALQTVTGQSALLSLALAGRVAMNPTTLACLGVLRVLGPATAGRLAQETGLTTGAIIGIADRLKNHDHVRR